jgi:hypothetical protein
MYPTHTPASTVDVSHTHRHTHTCIIKLHVDVVGHLDHVLEELVRGALQHVPIVTRQLREQLVVGVRVFCDDVP